MFSELVFSESILQPDWPGLPSGIGAACTTRRGGLSLPPYDDGQGGGGFNLGDHVADQPGHVQHNRAMLAAQLPAPVQWLSQVHGTRVLDVGAGANIIYPLIGHREYGWTFVGSELDAVALDSAAHTLGANPGLGEAILLRRQVDRNAIFRGVVQAGERFDLTLCNPPFHGSMREVRETAQAKWRKLGREAERPLRNFGGQGPELWCEGGEAGFIRRMITESADLRDRVRWFTTLVSSAASLPAVHRALRQVEARDIRTVAMAQGQKQSRFVAWTFLGAEARRAFSSKA